MLIMLFPTMRGPNEATKQAGRLVAWLLRDKAANQSVARLPSRRGPRGKIADTGQAR